MGRRGSLAASTFLTAFFCVIFTMVESPWGIRASTVVISLSATTMWAVLYGCVFSSSSSVIFDGRRFSDDGSWTPEIFGTKVRGTACGTASALSRV